MGAGHRLLAIAGGGGASDPVLEAVAARVTGAPVVRFEGVMGLLAAVRAWAEVHGPLAGLDVAGHASAGALGLSVSDPSELLSVCHRSFGYLVQLRAQGHLPEGAPITFVGCEIAGRCPRDRTHDGPLVMLAVARYLACPVAGATRAIFVTDFDERGLCGEVRAEHTLVVEPGSALSTEGWLPETPELPGEPLPGMTLRRVAPTLAERPELAAVLEHDAWWDGAGLLDRPGPALDAGADGGPDVRPTLDGRAVAVQTDGRRLVARVRRGKVL